MNFYRVEKIKQTSPNRTVDWNVTVDFIYGHNRDIVCKGGGMYAFWNDGKWNTNEYDLMSIIDTDVRNTVFGLQDKYPEARINGNYMSNNRSKLVKDFKEYTKLSPQSEVQFNTKILFSEDEIKKNDYATTKLQYTPMSGPTPAFDELVEKLYEPEQLEKIMWCMGALLTNNMVHIQKFLYLYGGKGTGKGTILNIFKMVFDGYYEPIDLANLTSDNPFATSEIKEVPLLIDDDTDLSNIKKDTNLLKLTAHEPLIINSKYKQTYSMKFQGLLIAASNQRYKVRNVDSGITRRAIVAVPTNATHEYSQYKNLMNQIQYELPMIAQKSIDIFNERGQSYYETYVDYDMIEATDHFYGFVRENALGLGDPCTLKRASELYKVYLEDMGYDSSGYKRKVKNELSRYYHKFHDNKKINGLNIKNVFDGFKWDIVFPDKKQHGDIKKYVSEEELLKELGIVEQDSIFDEIAKLYPAQLANDYGTPSNKWDDVITLLKDINTRELHYVRLPLNHIVLDFDIKDGDDKSLLKNLEAIKAYPQTYTELSKSGKGIHLHYIYEGDVSKLADEVSDNVEIKVFKGRMALRRKLTKCNNVEIKHISSGLPMKEVIDVFKDIEVIQLDEKKMRTLIKGNLQKKYHKNTKPSVDFIVKVFNDAKIAGIEYDLSDMRQDILAFAMSSSNQADACVKAISGIEYCSIDNSESYKFQTDSRVIPNEKITFYDIEVYPNLFVLAYRDWHNDDSEVILYNPEPEVVEEFCKKYLAGYNNRRYDNHIIYARTLGEDVMALYRQSQRIIKKMGESGFYSGAYELSYIDVYDMLGAANKKSLKKWEVELRIKHDEIEFPWDQPVDEKDWPRVGEYCMNDVRATEKVFDHNQSDYTARKILSELSGLSINATTNQHTTRIIFEGDKNAQKELVYVDLSKEFPGYTHEYGKSLYRGIDPKQGGYVYAEPGIYENVPLLDVTSMHPWSIIAMNMFGKYTKNFRDLVEARIFIKHKNYDAVRKLFDGRLSKYLTDDKSAKELSDALKTAINSAYGLTSASFDNPFRHKKNVDNIVAKRGALFMIDLQYAVQELGYQVAHIKTDSIKIPNGDQKIIDFVFEFGKKYGYTFEHEATYDVFALINKATYVCHDEKNGWSSKGTQLINPYVMKRLFTKEAVEKEDLFIVSEVKQGAAIHVGDRFVGKFCELYASKTGEEVFRVAEDKQSYLSGTKGYRWKLSSEYTGKDDVDFMYYENLVTATINDISSVGDASLILK